MTYIKALIARSKSFNPHTHTGCDDRSNPRQALFFVSIHTPIQGVTHFSLLHVWRHIVSIHTPIQGVTPPLFCGQRSKCCFNPHTHTGCDVSRHNEKLSMIWFQSTHPYRVWQSTDSLSDTQESFNPHTHTGCDSQGAKVHACFLGFNPHTHTGCDPCLMCYPLQ